MFIGQKLMKIRESRGLTQQALAEALNFKRGYIGDIENGRRQYLRGSFSSHLVGIF